MFKIENKDFLCMLIVVSFYTVSIIIMPFYRIFKLQGEIL